MVANNAMKENFG
jgi:hypothetical protein